MFMRILNDWRLGDEEQASPFTKFHSLNVLNTNKWKNLKLRAYRNLQLLLEHEGWKYFHLQLHTCEVMVEVL